MPVSRSEYLKAQRHLRGRDAVLKRLIATVGPCTLRYDPNRFASLVRSIISQQISTKAAASIRRRLEETTGPKGITPAAILALSDESLRAAGLSSAKVRSVRDLAEKVHTRAVPLHDLHRRTD